MPSPSPALAVLHRSALLVAVDKPSGLAVHRGQSRDPVHALQLVRDQVGAYVYPVHRLDRATSGVLLFALSADAARTLGDAFARGEVHKRYWALVRGAPPENVRVEHALSQEDDKPPQSATTTVTTLARYGRYALVEAQPETGRTHQIRRHLKHLSCPIIGDVRYGKGEHNRFFRERYGLHRLALHALSLSFVDPVTGSPLTIEAPLPALFAATLEALGRETSQRAAPGEATERPPEP
ncbi:MAG TPA: pseudouridine synthase [Polyangiaceae bacterium]|nr:pseudouridine synthase [Polyangiaceae bacterium]